ncbi:hypothetical protein GGD50_006004 [Rhizobium paranaense]|uniref:Uncharacterized protein n=1 Tax=Rhizobium paranaense TaxID=1650438 RepID=A0A7W9D4E0_9HYPH|nr:hypothetical protein [Rhizobium paranaense]
MKKTNKIEQAARELEDVIRRQTRPAPVGPETAKRPVQRNFLGLMRQGIELTGSLIRDALRGSATFYAGFDCAAAILGDYHAMSEDGDRKMLDDEQ